MLKDRKEQKRLYDTEYRRKNKELIKTKKKIDYENMIDHYRVKQKEYRSKPEIVEKHNEYCRQPEYVKQKRLWDIVYRSMKNYGEFWESAILVNQLEIEVRKRIPKNERLSYRRNVKIVTNRNNKRRLEKAIIMIESGESGKEILASQWLEESREILENLLCI